MSYKKFTKLRAVELKLLATLGMLTEQRRVFEIDNYPNYTISNYDRHAMETYFFADSHGFPEGISFIIHAEKEGETIISDDELDDYRRLLRIHGNAHSAEEILSKALMAGNELLFSVDQVDGFDLHGIEKPLIDNTGKTITFVGGYKADYSGIQPEGWGVYVICDLLAINARAVQGNIHLGILAEGLAMMLRKDYKLASFMFYCALESFINYRLNSHSDVQQLSQKLKKLIAATFPDSDLAKHSIYTSTINNFDQITRLRNSIAHGSKAVAVSKQESNSHLILVLTLIACVEKVISDFPLLVDALEEKDLSPASIRFWSSWKK